MGFWDRYKDKDDTLSRRRSRDDTSRRRSRDRDRDAGRPYLDKRRDTADEDDGVPFDEFADVLDDCEEVLFDIERHRDSLQRRQAELARLLQQHPELDKMYQKFKGQGGTTAEQWCKFCHGDMRPRLIRGKVYLIHNKTEPPIQLRLIRKRDDDEGPDAA